MANTLLTPSMITREALRVLHNNLVFVKGVNRQYSNEFAQSGAKIGSTVNIRKPNRYYVRTGQQMDVQQTNETYVPLSINRQWGVDISFSSFDLTLSLDDFSKRILTPAMARLASQIDMDGLAMAITGQYTDGTATQGAGPVYNCVGTAGSTPGTVTGSGIFQAGAPIIFLNAGMMMDNFATPRDENRRVVMNPAAHANSVAGLSGLFNDQSALSEQYRKGVMGNALGFEFAMDQNIQNLVTTSVTRVNGTQNGQMVAGNTIKITGCGVSAVINAGEVFTVAGCYSVNPENQQSTGQLQQFVVTQSVTLDGSGAGTVSVSPTIKLAGTGVADGTVSALPNNGTVTWQTGLTASTSYPQNLAYHQDAFTLATVDLEVPRGVDFAARETYDGISMRIVRAFDVTNDMFPCRIDILGGWATLRPEMACRILG